MNEAEIQQHTEWFDDVDTIIWCEKAAQNINKWGLQDLATLVLATDEEVMEVGAEIEDETTTDERALTAAFQEVLQSGEYVRDAHKKAYEGDDGTPLDSPPSFDIDFESVDLDELEAEVNDAGALLVQMKMAINRARDE